MLVYAHISLAAAAIDQTMSKANACVDKSAHDRCYFYAGGKGTDSMCAKTRSGDIECGAPSDKSGFFFTLGCYCILLLGLAIGSYFLNKKDSEADESKAYSAHFMGSKSFGWLISVLTFFSTIYSGYTINGVPSEAGSLGFYSVRWLTSIGTVFVASLVFLPRLRRTSVVRNHTSPNDLVTDRYDNKILSMLVFIFFVINNWIYGVAQFFTLHNVIAEVAPSLNAKEATWGFAILIFVCEVLGGFRAVAFSDAIQSVVMIFAMISIACIYEYDFGGMAGVVENHCENSHLEVKCASGNCSETPIGCLYNTAPHLTLHPATGESDYVPPIDNGSKYYNYAATRMFGFNMLFFAFGMNPHWIQRTMASNSDGAVKKVQIILLFAGLVVTLPGILEGICAKAEYGSGSFGVITNNLMEQGGFRRVIGIFAVCASFAAIMSTTDSAVLSISNMATTDILRNNLATKMSGSTLALIAKASSAIVITSTCAFALYYDDLYNKPALYGNLISFQNTILWQVVPTYFCAYYSRKTTAWALIGGFLVGGGIAFGLFFGIENENAKYGIPGGDELFVDAGLWGGLAAVVTVAVLTFALPANIGESGPHFDQAVTSRFGKERLSLDVVNEAMERIQEPVFTKIGAVCMFLILFVNNISLPWYGDSWNGCKYGWNTGGPDKGLPTTQEGCHPETLVGGLPQWFVGAFVAYILTIFLGLASWLQYKPQDEAYAPWCGKLTGVNADDVDADDSTIKREDVENSLGYAQK